MNETTTGVIRNNTFTRMRSVGVCLNYPGPVNSLLVENNTITGNATNIAQFQDWCGNRGVHGGMHICVWNQDGTGITLRGNTMSNNNRRALFVDRGTLVRNDGGNTSGGEECIPATMCDP